MQTRTNPQQLGMNNLFLSTALRCGTAPTLRQHAFQMHRNDCKPAQHAHTEPPLRRHLCRFASSIRVSAVDANVVARVSAYGCILIDGPAGILSRVRHIPLQGSCSLRGVAATKQQSRSLASRRGQRRGASLVGSQTQIRWAAPVATSSHWC